MVGNYWTTGITLSAIYNGEGNPPVWGASIEFEDDGHADSRSNKGTLRNSYFSKNPLDAFANLKQEMDRIGIIFNLSSTVRGRLFANVILWTQDYPEIIVQLESVAKKFNLELVIL